MMEGELAIADLPEAWRARFVEDFGISPPDDAHGVLQDIHWSAGLIGYFPTYTLGNVYAAQLMAAIRRDLPDLDGDMESGRFDHLLAWLRSRVHAAGRVLAPGRLIERATGEPVSADWLIASLHERYGPPHGL